MDLHPKLIPPPGKVMFRKQKTKQKGDLFIVFKCD